MLFCYLLFVFLLFVRAAGPLPHQAVENGIGFVQEFFFVVVVAVLISPSRTLVRICGSGWVVWIKCEILIINVRNHLDGQL